MTSSSIPLPDKVRTALRELPANDRHTVIHALDDEILRRRTASELLLTPVQRAMVGLLLFHIRRTWATVATPALTSFAEIV